MKGERILVADDDVDYLESFVGLLKIVGEKDGHTVVGSATSIAEVEELLKNGLKPTVVFMDNRFPDVGDGERAAGIIRQLSPSTIIVGNSSDDVKWADYDWGKLLGWEDRLERLNNLEHAVKK